MRVEDSGRPSECGASHQRRPCLSPAPPAMPMSLPRKECRPWPTMAASTTTTRRQKRRRPRSTPTFPPTQSTSRGVYEKPCEL